MDPPRERAYTSVRNLEDKIAHLERLKQSAIEAEEFEGFFL